MPIDPTYHETAEFIRTQWPYVFAAGMLACVVGVVMCFWGCRIIRTVMVMFGVVVGGSAAIAVLVLNGYDSAALVLPVAMVAGLVGGMLALVLLYVYIFLFGFVLVAGPATIAGSVMYMVGHSAQAVVAWSVGGVAGIVLGVLACRYRRVMVIYITAGQGAQWTAGGVLLAMSPLWMPEDIGDPMVFQAWQVFLLPLVVGLFIAGLVVQYRYTAPATLEGDVPEDKDAETGTAGRRRRTSSSAKRKGVKR